VFHLMMSAYWEPLAFELPAPPGNDSSRWHRLIDTALESPDDIAEPGRAAAVPQARYPVAPRSVVLLFAENG
jgi:glycogen operon protein